MNTRNKSSLLIDAERRDAEIFRLGADVENAMEWESVWDSWTYTVDVLAAEGLNGGIENVTALEAAWTKTLKG